MNGPGRILTSAYYRPVAEVRTPLAGEAREPGEGRMFLLMLCVLPMFAQSFQYVIDVLPLYALSKAWPILTLPLAVIGASRLDIPAKTLLLISYAWLFGVAPAVSIIELGNSFVGAMTTTIKVWSLSFVFSLAALLVWLQPSEKVLSRVVVTLGATTFIVMTLLYIFAPFSLFTQSIDETKLFLWDLDRGKRIYAPMFFGMLTTFYLNRSFWISKEPWKLLAIAASIAVQLLVYKQRASFGAAMLCLVVGAILSQPRYRGLMLALLIAVGGVAAVAFALHSKDQLGASLGGSLSVRQQELSTAVNFLSQAPWRWVVGVGSITRAGGDLTLASILQTKYFYLADLGWLGVAFEYGFAGVLLLLVIHFAGIYTTARASTLGGALPKALLDYVLYVLFSSAVYSVVFAPGELATCMAIGYYLVRRQGEDAAKPADEGPAFSQRTLRHDGHLTGRGLRTA